MLSRTLLASLIGLTACNGAPAIEPADAGSSASDAGLENDADAGAASDGGMALEPVPRAVRIARATAIPACTLYVDAANAGAADGSAAQPYPTIAEAIAALASGAVVCVAEGTYSEALDPGTKYFTLAGGFQSGASFTVRDSSLYVTRAEGDGTNTFFFSADPGPTEGQLTAIDGFEITGYSQAIVRDIYYSQRFDITNNDLHDNACAQPGMVGAGFSLGNVSGTISGNVIARNRCARGGGGALNDSTNTNSVLIANNLVDSNVGDEPDISHGGGLYLFANQLEVTANEFVGNRVTAWGAGLYIGAYTGGGQQTTAVLRWNVYRDNRAAAAGGGFFCDDSARCTSDHELYHRNCGGNIFLDSGPAGSDPTVAEFDHLTAYRGLTADCAAPGPGVQITQGGVSSDSYSFINSIFWGNGQGRDFETSCEGGCNTVEVTVAYSNVQSTYVNGGLPIAFGAGNLASLDPSFVGADAGDFHLQSTGGHWTPAGYVRDSADSPALGAGDDGGELGAYGDSVEASNVPE